MPTPAPPRRSDPARRRAWAAATLAAVGLRDARLEDAFAAVPREAFLPPPPWTLFGGRDGRRSTSDPDDLCDDVLVALDPARGVNNGSPTLHAAWLAALAVAPGDRVAHLGAGTGHYTAILAQLAGPGGRVEAVEIDPALARLAARAFATPLPGSAPVEVTVAEATERPLGEVDRVYVNFGLSAPARRWLDRLAVGGRLVMPLCVPAASGARWRGGLGRGLLVERRDDGFAARALEPCDFVYAEGAEIASPAAVARLREAFRHGGMDAVRSLRRDPVSPASGDWYVGDDWALSRDPPGGPSSAEIRS